ncbi:endospore germination permease [Bifidobacterium pullorum subsp. gallinarum]
MQASSHITERQVGAVVISAIIGVGILALPRIAAEEANTGAPLVTLLGIGIAFIGLLLLTLLGIRFPRESIFEYGQRIIGRPLAYVFNTCLAVFFILLTALAVREFGEVITSAVLRRTPTEVTIITMMILVVMATRQKLLKFTYFHVFYLPFILVPGLAIVLVSLQNAELLNLQPIIGNIPARYGKGALTIAALFQPAFIVTLLIPAMQTPKKAIKSFLGGIFISGTLYMLIVCAAVAVFGPHEINHLMWPTLELARATTIPGDTLERLDAIFIIVWVVSVFTSLAASYYISINGAQKVFGSQDHRFISHFFLPIVFILAMIPKSVFSLYVFVEIVGIIGLALTIGYPFILLIVALLRKVRGEPHGNSSEVQETD